MLKKQIESEFITAFKAKDTLKKNTLGIVKSKISEWEKSNPSKEIKNEDVLGILASEIKKRNQSIEIYKTNPSPQAAENAAHEEAEVNVLKTFLPEQLTEEEIKKEIDMVISQNPTAKIMPVVMGHFNKNLKGKFDNKQLQEILKANYPV